MTAGRGSPDRPEGMPGRIRAFLAKTAPLGIGDALIRISNFVVTALVARLGGPAALGVFALGQLTGHYVMLGSDFGLKAIGSRLLASEPHRLPGIVRAVQRKRAILAAAFVPAALLYSLVGPLPDEARWFVAASALAVLPQAFTLDWAMLGLERFVSIGVFRGSGAVLYAVLAAAGLVLGGGRLLWVAAATAASALLTVAATWAWWLPLARRAVATQAMEPPSTAAPATPWRAVVSIGIASMCLQLFQTVDTFMLGALSTAGEVGRYSAAYRILFVLFGLIYFVTQALYPRLARMPAESRSRVVPIGIYFACGGGAVALLLAVVATPLIVLVYGHTLTSAAPLLRVLLASLPLECVVALMGTALISWGHERPVLWATVAGAGSNVAMNLFLIPQRGAMGAAIATLACYLLLAAILLLAIRRAVGGGGQAAGRRRENEAHDASTAAHT